MKRVSILLAMLGCNARVQPQDSDASSSETSADATTDAADTSFPWPLPTSDDGASYNIIEDPDLGYEKSECDLWSQDCPPGEKCMPHVSDGEDWWNSTRCSPLAPDPKQLGDACTVVDSATSGIDDCVSGAMCWDVDPETLVGECVGLCQGSEANPVCEDPCATCALSSEGVLSLCVASCNPLLQPCGEGRGCYAVVDAFFCAPDMSGRGGAIGESCDFINACDAGLICANPEYVPGCDGASCCTPFCDVDASDECDAVLPGTSCVAWFDSAVGVQSCFGSGRIGFCAVPQ